MRWVRLLRALGKRHEGGSMDDRKRLNDEVAEILNGQRDIVIADVRAAVIRDISTKTPGNCLTLVQRDADGEIVDTLPMAASKRYAGALFAFVRKSNFEGKALDSALTDPTAELVADIFMNRVGEKANEITERIIPLVISNQRFVEGLSSAILSSYSGPIPQQLQRKITSALTSKLTAALAQSVDATTTATVKATVTKVAAASISSPIAMKVSLAVVKSLSVALKPIIVKLLGSAVLKAAIASKIKVVVFGAILGAFIKLIGIKLGLTAGTAYFIFLLPIIIAWIAYEVSHFPGKLADKVAEGIAADLAGNFAETTRSLAETIVERVLVDGTGLIAAQLINDDALIELIQDISRDAA
jgi:hypothetical protein